MAMSAMDVRKYPMGDYHKHIHIMAKCDGCMSAEGPSTPLACTDVACGCRESYLGGGVVGTLLTLDCAGLHHMRQDLA